MTDKQEIVCIAAVTVGCGCVVPALVVLGFIWGIASIFEWTSA